MGWTSLYYIINKANEGELTDDKHNPNAKRTADIVASVAACETRLVCDLHDLASVHEYPIAPCTPSFEVS